MDTTAWEAAGLYSPDAVGAEERKALLTYLTQRGATIDQMIAAHANESLPALGGELVWGASAPSQSVAEVAATVGVSVGRVERVLLAAGLPTIAQSPLPDDLATFMTAFEQGADILGQEAVMAFTRVLGAAATTIAEAAVALFYAELGPGANREGTDELARAKAAESATLAFAQVPDVLASMLLAQFRRAGSRAAVSRGWQTRQGGGGEPSEEVALGFVDLVGSTAWAERLTLRDQSLALSRFESAAWSAAVLGGGRVVKMIGDAAFFSAPTADAACRIGLEICRVAAADSQLPAARGAVGFGAVTPREGDYFGPLVNLVSRLVKAAPPGRLVVTDDAGATLKSEHWSLQELDPADIRGIERDVVAYVAHPTNH